MKWKNKNPDLHTVAEVVFRNTGMSEKEMEEIKEYNIHRMKEVADLIKHAIKNNVTICVVADYDADGINSAAILRLMLDALHAKSYIRLPRRVSEGYGLNPNIVDELPENSLLICVDNGISAIEAIAKAKSKGMTSVILDHHLAPEDGTLPCADIIIDPAVVGEADFRYYCGAGLAYKLAVELLGKEHPTVKKCLSFAAIATVADVMPLLLDNRVIVKKGLKTMMSNEGRTKGLEALIILNGLDVAINEDNIGFKIAPCINAPGRLYDNGAEKAYNLLICDNEHEAMELAKEIVHDNELRKVKKDEGIAKLEMNISKNNFSNDTPLVLYEPQLEEGVVGLFAGHFAEVYKRPCIVLTDSSTEGVYKGSGRSYGDVHLKELLDKHAGLIYKYGGHKGAAGLSVCSSKLDDFRAALKKELLNYEVPDTCYYDLEIDSQDIPQAINDLLRFAPYGEGNPRIVFKINNFQVMPTAKGYVQVMGNKKYAKVVNKDKTCAITFGLGERLMEIVDEKPKTLDFYGKLALNISKYGTVKQIEVDDFDLQNKNIKETNLAAKLQIAAKK